MGLSGPLTFTPFLASIPETQRRRTTASAQRRLRSRHKRWRGLTSPQSIFLSASVGWLATLKRHAQAPRAHSSIDDDDALLLLSRTPIPALHTSMTILTRHWNVRPRCARRCFLEGDLKDLSTVSSCQDPCTGIHGSFPK